VKSFGDPALLHNLPLPVSSFVGRAGELGEITGLLSRSRLVTLTGPGGVGKTRLALQAAFSLLDGSGDGVWLAELAPITDPGLVAATVAAAVGVEEAPDRPVLQTLVHALRTRELLIVLDNCEHVIRSAMSLADAILRHCGRVHLLATSREPLGVAGEHVYRVPPLTIPGPGQPLGGEKPLRDYEAIRLFLDRASAHQPGFLLNDTTALEVASVCRQLDGMPLAIELAAARLRSLSVSEIERRLDDRFRLLTGGYRSALPRHQTLRALVDWSYDLLSPAERSVLRRISVFAGSFDLAPAEEIAAAEDVAASEVLDIVTSLVDKSLLQVEPCGTSVRYRLLDTVRDYAMARLAECDAADGQDARDRHAAVFLRLAASAAQHLEKPDEAIWRDRLEVENANLGAAFRHLAGRPGRGEDLLSLAETLYPFSVTRGAIQEHLGMLRAALDHPDTQQPTAARARALLTTSTALVRAGGDRCEAEELQRASLVIARSLGDPGLTASILTSLSTSVVITNHSSEAVAEASGLADEAVTLSRSGRSADQLGRALRARSAVYSYAEQYEAACRDNLEATGLFRSSGNGRWLSRTLNNLASDEIALGEFDDAQRHLEEALPYAAGESDTSDLAYVLGNLSLVHLLRGDPAAARGPALESLKNVRTDDKRALYAPTLYLALCCSAVGQFETAAVLHGAVDAMGVVLEPLEIQLRDEDHRELAAALGDHTLQNKLAEGRALESTEKLLLFAITSSGPESSSAPVSPGVAQLSNRERQLVALVAQGHTDAQIAERLYISVRTVRSHLDRIRDKSGCRRRADLTRMALQDGLI
jgi:predicted ATPase/DNA-binding CsgD family transcriptional regulator